MGAVRKLSTVSASLCVPLCDISTIIADHLSLLGAHSRTGTTQFQKSYNLRQIIKHKGYSRRHLRNDIALLQLETPIDASLHVNVVCLPKAGTRVGPGKKCYLTGKSTPTKARKMSRAFLGFDHIKLNIWILGFHLRDKAAMLEVNTIQIAEFA